MHIRAACLVLASGLLAPGLLAQPVSRNVELMAVWKSPTNPTWAGYSDVWGYHDPDTGRELAIIGSTQGVHFVDCTDPRNPVEVSSFVTPVGGSGNGWRDIKTFGHHAYEVSEAYGGTRIFGLLPQTPPMKAWWGQSFWGNAHNIAMDRGTGIAYACGTNRGVVMFSCTQNPSSPTHLGRFASPYIHDLAVQDGYGYLCDQNGNNLLIMDVTNAPTLVELSRIRLPGASIAHNCWPSRDGTICVATNEAANGPVSIFDVSNKRAPRLIAQYRVAGVTSSPHNAYIRDHVAHISYYQEGYRSVDLSDPANPVEVGFYDTYPGDTGGFGFAGCWGCYHEQPTGIVYASDINHGLFVLKPKSTAVLYGAATAGTGGVQPTIHAYGAAYSGNGNFKIEVDRARANAPAAVFIAPAKDAITLQGLAINVSLGAGLIVRPFTTDAAGKGAVAMPIRSTLTAGTFYAQGFVADAGGSALGLSATQGMALEVFVR